MNTDSGNYAKPAHFDGIEKYDDVRDDEALFKCMAECRVTKVSTPNGVRKRGRRTSSVYGGHRISLSTAFDDDATS